MAVVDESRCAFLLNPIKDLAKNWEIDLSKFLEQYMSELSTAAILVDCGGETVMNFAEAAMLLQGSAGVYSRKVEFLWSLVQQMLDLLANKKAAQAGGKGRSASSSADANSTVVFDSVTDMPQCKKRFKEGLESPVDAIKYLPVTPVCLVDKDATHKSLPLLSLTGELLANKDDFRLNYVSCSETGMLCTEIDIERMLRLHTTPVFIPTHTADLSVRVELAGDMSQRSMLPQAVAANEDGSDESDDGAQMNIFPSPPATPDRGPSQLNCSHQQQTPPLCVSTADIPSTAKHAAVGALTRRKARPLPCPLTPPVDTDIADPWRPLDMYDTGGSRTLRPLRRGRITKPPPCLCHQQDKSKRKRKRAAMSETVASTQPGQTESDCTSPPPPISDYLRQHVFSSGADEKLLAAGRGSAGRLMCHQLGRLSKCLHVEAAQHKEWCQQQLDELSQHQQLRRPGTPLFDKMSDACVDDLSDVDDAELFNGDDEDEAVPLPLTFPSEPAAAVGLTENRIVSSQKTALPDGDGGDDSYVDLVQRRVAEYLSAAQQYVQSTELSRRVALWQQNVRPRLDQEAGRAQFDIHQYGSRLLGRLQETRAGDRSCDGEPDDTKERVMFADAVKGEPPAEVARFLLSALMLANTHNVDIDLVSRGDDASSLADDPVARSCQPMDCVRLTLLSTYRHHDVFNDQQQTASLAASRRRKSGISSSGDTASSSSQQQQQSRGSHRQKNKKWAKSARMTPPVQSHID